MFRVFGLCLFEPVWPRLSGNEKKRKSSKINCRYKKDRTPIFGIFSANHIRTTRTHFPSLQIEDGRSVIRLYQISPVNKRISAGLFRQRSMAFPTAHALARERKYIPISNYKRKSSAHCRRRQLFQEWKTNGDYGFRFFFVFFLWYRQKRK